MRIAVPIRFVLEQRAALAEHLDDFGIGVSDLHSCKQRSVGQESAVTAHRIVDRQAIFLTDNKVILAMRRRRVYGTRSCLRRNMLAENDRHLSWQKWMRQFQTFERRAREIGQYTGSRRTVTCDTSVAQRLGQH